MLEDQRPVPVRTILATIGLVLATGVTLWLVVRLARIEAILIVAVFFAVVLNPLVELAQRRLHVRRGLAVAIVFLVVFGLLAAMLYAFIRPLVDQGQKFADDYPRLVREAKAGKGPKARGTIAGFSMVRGSPLWVTNPILVTAPVPSTCQTPPLALHVTSMLFPNVPS